MTKEERKALGLTEEQVAADYEKNYVEKSRSAAKEDKAKAAKEEHKTACVELCQSGERILDIFLSRLYGGEPIVIR